MTNTTTLRPDCAKRTSMGPCIAVEGHFGRCRPLHNRDMALYSASLVAQLEQAQWSLRELPLSRGIDEDEEWGYAFDTAVPMIYGGYIL